MKNFYSLIGLFFMVVIFFSCNKKDSTPSTVARFQIEGDHTFAPAVVKFINKSEHADKFHWTFGDGSVSTEENPMHIYNNGGIYTVTLEAEGPGGSDTDMYEVIIKNIPTHCFFYKLIINDLPFTDPNTGSGWDVTNGPDVFFQIIDVNNNVLYGDQSLRIENVIPDSLPLIWEWNVGNYWEVPSLNAGYKIEVYDYDLLNSNDLIGQVDFFPPDFMTITQHYPDTLHLINNDLSIDVLVEWEQ